MKKDKHWESILILVACLFSMGEQVQIKEMVEEFIDNHLDPKENSEYWFEAGTLSLFLATIYKNSGDERYKELLSRISEFDILDPEETMASEFEYQRSLYDFHLNNENIEKERIRNSALAITKLIYFPIMVGWRKGENVRSSEFDQFSKKLNEVSEFLKSQLLQR